MEWKIKQGKFGGKCEERQSKWDGQMTLWWFLSGLYSPAPAAIESQQRKA